MTAKAVFATFACPRCTAPVIDRRGKGRATPFVCSELCCPWKGDMDSRQPWEIEQDTIERAFVDACKEQG